MLLRFLIPVLAAIGCVLPARSQQKQLYSQLWKVSGEGLPAPSYLFGTQHSIGGVFVDSFPAIGRALGQSSLFIRETLPGQATGDYQDVLFFPPHDSLQRYMSPAAYDTLFQYFRTKLTGPDTVWLREIPRYKPQAIRQLIIDFKAEEASGNAAPAQTGIDDYLQQLATARGIRLAGLETTRDQVLALNSSAAITEEAPKLAGMAHGKEVWSGKPFQDQQSAEYRSRRIPYHFGYQPATQYEQAMVAERNRKWVVKLLPMITKEPAFIAVGLDHLRTAEGLVALLRKAGYTVTNIPL